MTDSYVSRAERKQHTRDALIEAAATLLAEQGLRGATMEAIAARAELHVQTLYRHFPNKSALLSAIEEQKFNSQREALSNPRRRESTLSLRLKQDLETLKGLHAGGVRTLLDAWSDPELAGVHMLMADRYIDLLSTHLAEEMGYDENDPQPRMIATMLHWGGWSVLKSMQGGNYTDVQMIKAYKQAFKCIEDMYTSLKRI